PVAHPRSPYPHKHIALWVQDEAAGQEQPRVGGPESSPTSGTANNLRVDMSVRAVWPSAGQSNGWLMSDDTLAVNLYLHDVSINSLPTHRRPCSKFVLDAPVGGLTGPGNFGARPASCVLTRM